MNHVSKAVIFGLLLTMSAVAMAQTTLPIVNSKQLHPFQFKPRMDARSVAYLPVGSLEWHGEHLPNGTDGLRIEALCERAAQQGGGIVIPATYLGMGSMVGWNPSYGFTNNVTCSLSQTTFTNMLIQQIANLDRLRFKVAILVAGHHPSEQIDTLTNLVASYHPQYGMKLQVVTDRDLAQSMGQAADHGGKWETSIMMYLHPELVDVSKLPQTGTLYGVSGEDPRFTASAAFGEQVVTQMVNQIVQQANDLLPVASNLTYDFNDNTLQGWTNKSRSTAASGYYDLTFGPAQQAGAANGQIPSNDPAFVPYWSTTGNGANTTPVALGARFLGEIPMTNSSITVELGALPNEGCGAHQTLSVQSPAFTLNGSGDLTVRGMRLFGNIVYHHVCHPRDCRNMGSRQWKPR